MYNKSVTKIGIYRRQRDAPEEGLDSLRGLCFGWRWNCYLLLEGFEDAPEGYIFHCNCFLKD